MEKAISALPGYDPHQVYGAVITIQTAQRLAKANPERFADLDPPVLTKRAVREKVVALYRWAAVVPESDRRSA